MNKLEDSLLTLGKPISKKLSLGLIVGVIILQLSVLVVEYLGSVWPIWFGKPVILETQPIDPRSLFRGNYVRLNFAINRIEQAELMPDKTLKEGSVAYLQLKEEHGVWQPVGLGRKKPDTGDFIKGRVKESYEGYYLLEYGIEAFFMPKKAALRLESETRRYSRFEVYISKSGKARVNSVLCTDEACTISPK